MRVPYRWLREFVDTNLPVEEVARRLTMAGLEVEAVHYVGLPLPRETRLDFKVQGFAWDPERIVVGEVREVMPHPNADRLVLARVFDGQDEHVVVTGAPNLFPYKARGPLDPTLKVAFAREGAVLQDPYNPGKTFRLKRRKLRGIESYAMVCSERELGISDEHEGIILLDPEAPTGMPLAMYMGDAVLDIAITPNLARCLSVLGVARELAALLDLPFKYPSLELAEDGPPIQGRAAVEIREPELNPRFAVGLIEGVRVGPSPYWVQYRLRLAGMRPINNIVDATNYVMLEWGQPLHAFDYDLLVERADGKAPTIITRRAQPGEQLTTLDGETRTLDPDVVVVADTRGALSIAGVMGGAETEVRETTTRVLLESATWNPVNIRRTRKRLKLLTDAAYRYERGVHPALVEPALRRALALMQTWAGGTVAQGFVDVYPRPHRDPVNVITEKDVERGLGIRLPAAEIARLLERLEFQCTVEGSRVVVKTPPHRLDIGEGVVGRADLLEEIARLYGYDRIPETRLADELPPQVSQPAVERQEGLKDLLTRLGFQEVITYRLTAPEREARMYPEGQHPQRAYVSLVNPISQDRRVLRTELLPGMLEVAEANARFVERQALFELGPVFLPRAGELLPEERPHLALLLTGPREEPFWAGAQEASLDFYDLKGRLETLFQALKLEGVAFEPGEHPAFHPGKRARIRLGDRVLGEMGELHPLVQQHYDYFRYPVVAAELDADLLMETMPEFFAIEPIPQYPPVIEDLAFIVDEQVPAQAVLEVIRQAGQPYVVQVILFDVYTGPPVPQGKRSLAFRVTYQAPDRTLTDKQVARIREGIVRQVEKRLGGQLRA